MKRTEINTVKSEWLKKTYPLIAAGFAALLINIILFNLLSALGDLFLDEDESLESESSRIILYEYRKPEQEKKMESAPQLHEISSHVPSEGSHERITMDFTPDLSVEAGSGVSVPQQDLSVMVLDENETDNPLVPLYTPNVKYPRRAVDLGIEGILEVLLIIETDGSVMSVEIIQSPHPSFSSAARDVISTWRFKPATNNGIPVRVRAVQSIEFRLD